MAKKSGPPLVRKRYNQSLPGFYGEFGTGGNAQIFFLQAGIKPTDLDKTTLISNIPGSECWSVRNLFQREVDIRRVTSQILPYFKNPDKVKFFNPLTLTLLPMDLNICEVLTEMPVIRSGVMKEDDRKWITIEMPDYYRFRHLENHPEYGLVEWNDSKVKIVAIDGQHRLSALKRYLRDTSKNKEYTEFMKWTVPVVVFGLRALEHKGSRFSILDVIRSIFIFINTEARVPNETRQILLRDESINGICTQELLDYAHQNDIEKPNKRNRTRIPLLFFDWRGEEDAGRQISSPGSVKSIVEIRDWLEYYLLGEDFDIEQEEAFGIQPVSKLHRVFKKGSLDVQASREVRKAFERQVLPGLAYFLENFVLYKQYISDIRKLEDDCYKKESDVEAHAFYQVRFGTNRASEDLQKSIRAKYDDIIFSITELVNNFPQLVARDIGMRGVMCAFGQLRHYYARSIEKSVDWLTYAKWFTKIINRIYEDHWLDDKDRTKHNLLLHITYDPSDNVVNYRLHQAYDAFGAFISILVGAYGGKMTRIPKDNVWDELYEDFSDGLTSTLKRGCRKQMRAILREKFPKGGKPLNEAVEKSAQRATRGHLKKFDRALSKIRA